MSNLNNPGLLSQINHLNSYINKRIDFLDSKIDTSLQDLNEKLDILTNKLTQIADSSNNSGSAIANNESNNSLNEAKVVNILTRNFNNLIKDLSSVTSTSTNIGEISSSNYNQPLLANSAAPRNNQEPSPQDHPDSFHQAPAQDPQQNPQSQSQTPQQHEQTTGQPTQSQNNQTNNQQANQFPNFQEYSRPWAKSLSLRSPVPQPNSAPSSPFMSNRFSFDFNTFPLERSASFSRTLPFQNQQPDGTINASNIQGFQQHQQQHQQQNHVQQTQQDLIIPNTGLLTSNTKRNQRGAKKVQSVPINSSSYLLSLNAPNILASSGQVNAPNAASNNSAADTTDSSNPSNSNVANSNASSNNIQQASNLGSVYQLNNFANEGEHGIDDLRNTAIDPAISHDIQNIQNIDPIQKHSTQPSKKRRKNSKSANKTPKLSKQQQPQQVQAQAQKGTKDDAANDVSTTSNDELNAANGASSNSSSSSKSVPGSAIISNKKYTNVPQYKLEKSLKSVQEIWQEYEYGLNDKPPLKFLEAKYNTKWRNETESRTFLRRKKIYEAIENGKGKGFDESSIIEELEQLRTYNYFDAIKKRPLQWLYSNIPTKYSNP